MSRSTADRRGPGGASSNTLLCMHSGVIESITIYFVESVARKLVAILVTIPE